MSPDDVFPSKNDYFNAFIKTAQYITNLTSHQDLLTETGNAITRFYGAGIIGFFELQQEDVTSHHWIIPNGLSSDIILTTSIRKVIADVFTSGFLETRFIDLPDRYAVAFLPITWENKTTAVMLLGHRTSVPIPDDLLNTYLAVAGLVSTSISNAVAAFEHIAERKRAEDELRVARENLAFLVSNTPAVLYRFRASQEHRITFISDNVRKLTGYESAMFLENPGFWKDHIHPDDYEAVLTSLEGFTGSGLCASEYRFLCSDGVYRWMHDESKLLSDNNGNLSERLGYLIDITPRKVVEQKLVRNNEELCALNEELTAIQEELLHTNEELTRNEQTLISRNEDLSILNEELSATEEELQQNVHELLQREQELQETEKELRKALDEKEVLLSEIHHRVKNNLTAFISLLSLEGSYEDTPAGKSLKIDLQNRARSMALIHETLYRTGKFSDVDMHVYLNTLIDQIVNSYQLAPVITTVIKTEGITLDLSRATTTGLIINELITNSFKYAFPPGFDCREVRGESGKIQVLLSQENGGYELTVSDNGRGLPADLDPLTTKTLGLKLVNFLARHQLRADIRIQSDEGTKYIFMLNKK